jgi:predicted XRE-type DNA-binding protein
MSKKPEVTESDGNIFADLGTDNADEFYTRACLGVQAMKLLKGRCQKEAAKLLGCQTAGNIRAYAREIQPFQSGAVNWLPK